MRKRNPLMSSRGFFNGKRKLQESRIYTRPLEFRVMLLLLFLFLPVRSSHATAGFAEYSWYFHDQPGQWIEWHHGDICPPEAAHKNCILIRQSKIREGQLGPRPLTPYNDSPQKLYLPTILALLPLALACLGVTRLLRRWRQRTTQPSGWSLRSTWAWSLMTVAALFLAPHALAVLFPASPSADGWIAVISLSFNILIVAAPLTLWWNYRRLFPPPGRVGLKGWSRVFLWFSLLPSSILAPLLLWGPPNLLMYLFPPTVLPNIVVSLFVVWVASKAANVVLKRMMGSSKEPQDGGSY